ncbi:MAG TPA: hypothetical protein VHO68_13165 [Bacteroidales bacterium]|nr:hypothetical protein [Bacteroidales bacterium]
MKTRSIILVIITLIIGFVLGMLTSAQIRYKKLQPVRMYFSPERFREGFYKVIQPDDKQKEEIDAVIEKFARINGDLQNNFRREFETNMKEFRKEVDSRLTKDQLARLKEMDEKRQEMIRQNRKDRANDTTGHRWHGRGFDGPPPASRNRADSGSFRP